MRLPNSYFPTGYVPLGVKGWTCQGWEVDWAPANLRNCPTNCGVISTPLPIKFLSLASPGLKPKWRVQRADVPAHSKWTGLAWAAKPITGATLGIGTSVCLSLGDACSTRQERIPPQDMMFRDLFTVLHKSVTWILIIEVLNQLSKAELEMSICSAVIEFSWYRFEICAMVYSFYVPYQPLPVGLIRD